jgi:site-specific DNA-methyltransferase (adenine-specific)
VKGVINQFKLIDTFEAFKELPDESVDMILTDIPYLISRETNFAKLNRYKRKNKDIRGYEGMDFGNWDKEFDVELYIRECARILKKGRSMIVFGSWQQLKEINDIIQDALGKDTGSPRIGVWEKSNPAVFNMDKMPINAFEFFVWNRKGKNWVFHNQRGKRVKNNGTETQIPERFLFNYPIVVGGHKTAKPIGLFEDLIKTFTDEGQVVFDGCAGGGTTAISALRTNRQFICFENNEENYEIAKQNFQKYQIDNLENYFK